jgi:Tol biopolymer transport system component
MRLIKYLFIIIFFGLTKSLFSQGINTPFGQNRVQYGRFDWNYLRVENFDAYYYSGGKELATYCLKYVNDKLPILEDKLEHPLSGRIEIICFNTQSDLKQSNFGLEDLAQNTGGYTQVNSNKIYIYFNGDHADLARQLNEGIALVIINEVLYGGSLQERIQNAALLNLPEWFLHGLTSYISKDWDADMDNRMKDGVLTKKFKKFNRLNQKDAVFAGHSIWKYIIDNNERPEEVIKQVIYAIRVTRNYESALSYVCNDKNFKQIQKDWFEYYQKMYSREDVGRNMPLVDIKIKRRVAQYIQPQMKVSSKGDYVSFTSNKNGKYKVYLLNTKTNKLKKILKGGIKYYQLEYDYSFPTVAWQQGGDKLAMVYEKKGKLLLKTIDLVNKSKETVEFFKFDKITGFDYSDNGRTLVVSAIRKGQSDIFTFDIPSRKEKQLTNDIYDDANPRYTDGSSKIIFSSNRPTDSLNAGIISSLRPDNNYDVYLYDIEESLKTRMLKRLTKTPYINETNPIEYKRNYYAYLSDYNGTKNRYATRLEEEYDYTAIYIKYLEYTEKPIDTLCYVEKPKWNGSQFTYRGKLITIDSTVEKIDTIVYNKDLVYTYPITNYQRGILAHDVSVQSKTTYDLMLYKNKYYIKMSPQERSIEEWGKTIESYPNMFRLKSGVTNKQFESGLRIFRSFAEQINSPDTFYSKQTDEAAESEIKIIQDTTQFFFISEFTPEEFKRPAFIVMPKIGANEIQKRGLKISTPKFYDVTFFADQVVTQIDNSIINTYYQPIGGAAEQMFNPGLNGMFKLGMIDLLEDYRFTGGIRVSFDGTGFDYFASFETLKKRLDHKFVFYRQSRSGGVPENNNAVKSYSHELRYILKYPISQTSSLRLNIFGRTDRDILRGSNNATLETPDRVTNWIGAKAEYVFDNTVPKGLNLWNGTRLKLFYERYANLDDWNVQLNAIGFDARHYEKIHRQIIWCTRLTANSSFGPAKVVYYLGGVENWILPRFNNESSTSSSENYVFQALAANLRGFEQNIRNGNNFALLNTEIRVPIFQYAFNRPLRSEFLNNFQIVPFFDMGTAWIGSNPYGDDNTFNQKTINVAPVFARVTNVRDPLVAGFGGGLRTKVLGYFLRFDTAWGIQDAEIASKPVYYFALGLDF